MEKNQENKKVEFAFDKTNFKLMGIGLAIIVLGFVLMSGGASDDPAVFNDAMFSFRRITIAPLLVFGGFIFEIYAIMKKPQE